jgi:hypothetical protein
MAFISHIPDLPVFEGLDKVLEDLIQERGLVWKQNQMCINAIADHPDDYHLGVNIFGKEPLTDEQIDYMSRVGEKSPADIEWIRQNRHIVESSFSDTLCTVFEGTPFEEIFYEVSKKYVLGRMRITKLFPSRILAWHKDVSNRIHYPITTNEHCAMIYEGNHVVHLPANNWWYARVSEYHHTAYNASHEERIHINAMILEEK